MPELNVGNENSVELVKGESGLSDAIVNNEAKSLERTETSQVGVYVANENDYSDTSRTLQVSQENNPGVYSGSSQRVIGFERSKGEEGVVNTITVDETKELIKIAAKELDEKIQDVTADLSGYYTKTESNTRFALLEQGFNVINASDISSNTLTADQYAIITNGKPTLIKGTFLSRTNMFIYSQVEQPSQFIGQYIAGLNYGTIAINKTTKVISISPDTSAHISLSSINMINGKSVPSYPSSAGTFTLKCVDGILTWVAD